MDWKLYIHTNKINGKKYIGITGRKNVNDRWQNGKGYEKQIFGKAIKKYGWDGFTHEVIAHGSEEEIKKMEEELIKKYRTQDRRFGYNVKSGGDGGKLSEDCRKELKKKLRTALGKRVYRYELWGELSKKYNSYTELEDERFDVEEVKKNCKGNIGLGYHKGYMWSNRELTKEEFFKITDENYIDLKWEEEEEELKKTFSEYIDVCEENGLVYRDIDCVDCKYYFYGVKSINCERCSNEFYP